MQIPLIGRILGNTAGALLVIAVFLASLGFFSVMMATRSHPPKDGLFEVELLKDSVEIYRDQFSIPHIIARSEADAFFSLGFAHAQDRLWQMDMARRAGRGRLSEVLGKDALAVDKFMRALDISKTAAANFQKSSRQSKSILTAYSNGINAFIQSNQTALSFEFDALGYKPAPWTPEDCLVIGRMMSFELSLGFWNDLIFGRIAEKVGPERAAELIAGYPAYAPTVLEVGTPRPQPVRDTTKAPAPDSVAVAGQLLSELHAVLKETRDMLGIRGSAIGSNSWAMRKTAFKTTSAVLANDPHLTLTMPARWYQAHLTCPTMNVVGLTIPGIPLFIAGRNDNIAWGITNMMADDVDYFIEKLDSSKNTQYIAADGKAVKFKYQRDTIYVKSGDSLRQEYYDIRRTNRSAVLSDIHLMRRPDIMLNRKGDTTASYFMKKYLLTFAWTANSFSDELSALYKINKARSWDEFTAGTNAWGTPALNFTYADKRGNIGIAPSGQIPRRGNTNPNFPNIGWTNANDWQGFITGASLPKVYNPSRRYVASANNLTSRSLPAHITSFWEPPSRAERIEEMLLQANDYSVRDAQLMQMDVTSPFARQVMEYVLPVLERNKNIFKNEYRAYELLSKWQHVMTAQDVEPAIFNTFMSRMYENTFQDELGESIFREYLLIANIPTRKILELLPDSTNMWFDDIRSKATVETRNMIILKSFLETVQVLSKQFDDNQTAQWRFGEIHTLTIPHIFSENKFLKPAVTMGPFPTNGSNTTINSAEWKLFAPYKQVVGASMRFVADLQDSVVYSVLPGGSSGQPLSAHYSDQMQLWLNGGYVAIPVAPKASANYTSRSVLKPRS
ncbi:MAG TPA: penicillin acylase family protein [Patescibacteria group bacterium]|nr:penicillin acylase family protein [Patescibacteria group bacterium]